MAFQPRGGPPIVRTITVATNGAINGGPVGDPDSVTGAVDQRRYDLPAVTTWIAVQATNFPVRIYFNRADFVADANYLYVSDQFSGPYETSVMWFRGDGGTSTVQLVLSVKG